MNLPTRRKEIASTRRGTISCAAPPVNITGQRATGSDKPDSDGMRALFAAEFAKLL
jgi:hypothetical protein